MVSRAIPDAPAPALDASPSFTRRIVGPLRLGLFLLLLGATELACRAIHTVVIAIPGALIPAWRRRFDRTLWNGLCGLWGRLTWLAVRFGIGIRLEVEGTVPEGRLLIVSNHQSTLDIPVIFHLFRSKNLKFIVKKELLEKGIFQGLALRNAGFGVVDFDSPVRSLAGLVNYCEALEGWNGSAVLFPEGIRTFDGTVGPFHASGLRLIARRTGLPIVPLVLDGAWRGRTLGGFARLPGRTIRVRILPPLAPCAGSSADAPDPLTSQLEATIRSELSRLRAGHPAEASSLPRSGRIL